MAFRRSPVRSRSGPPVERQKKTGGWGEPQPPVSLFLLLACLRSVLFWLPGPSAGRHPVSRGDLVIVMQPSEHPASFDSSSGYALPGEGRGAECGWAALLDSLVRSRTVEVRAVLGNNALQMAFAEEEDVVQAFPAQRADETLDIGGGLGCEDWRSHDSDSSATGYVVEGDGELAVVVAEQELRGAAEGSEVPHLLDGPAAVGAIVDAPWTSCRVSRWMTTKT
jgi:hypothetical protein